MKIYDQARHTGRPAIFFNYCLRLKLFPAGPGQCRVLSGRISPANRPAELITRCRQISFKLFCRASVPIRSKIPHLISECLKTHVPFVDRALSEIPEAKADSLRNVQAGQVQAVAVGIGVVQNRAHLFSCVPIRCPGSGSRNVQRHSPFIVL